MVLSIYLYFVFALSERKNEIQKKTKYRSAEGLTADGVSSVILFYSGSIRTGQTFSSAVCVVGS